MELSHLLLMGGMSGLVAVLAHSILYSIYELIRLRGTHSSSLTVTDAFLHLICGGGLGLLFWLSWGLAAIVAVPWWVRGVTFALLCWVPLSLPAVVAAWVGTPPERGLSTKAMAMMASRWGMTCLVAGLTCAWSWENSF
ncbi:MAG TPA: hypothetical protein VGE08_11120 [Steroidobacter sp.]|uniref:hypothetical protein n=1 Tax=Steroidobacter sp. TaxID=1978227 RepID=UPI002ED861CA